MRQAGRYLPEYREIRARVDGFLDLCFTPELAIEVTMQPIRRFAMDAAILFSDILVIPHALGQPVRFEDGRGPVLEAIGDEAAISRLAMDRLHDRLGPVYETIAGLRAALPAETALIGFAGAPWTVATYMVEGGTSRNFERIKGLAYGAPDTFQQLIDLLVEATSDYVVRQIEAGAEVIQLFDTWAGVLPEPAFERWCLHPVAEIAKRIAAAHPEVPVIAFPRGAGLLYARFADAAPVAALSLDTTVPLGWARDTLQRRCTVQGNLDPILLLAGGDALKRETARILEALGHGPFVFNLGHGIVPQTPPEHVAQLAEQIRSWRR